MSYRTIAWVSPVTLLALLTFTACGGGGDTSSSSSSGSSSSGGGSGGSGGGNTSSSSSTSSTSSTSTSSTSTSSSTSSTSSSSSSGGTACQFSLNNNPCGSGFYCDAPGCGMGTCQPIGSVESDQRDPVCGCDDVTHWNGTIAAKRGMAVKSQGACNPGKTCGGFGNLQCPSGVSCNMQVASKVDCNIVDGAGTCWAMPSMCPPILIGPNTRACASLSCTDECNLIKLMTPWYVDNTCPQ